MSDKPAFASTGDLTEKTVSFAEIGPGLFAYTAQGDPNSGVIVASDRRSSVEAPSSSTVTT